MNRKDFYKFVTLLVLTVIAYIPTIMWMIDRWTEKDTYYSHGFLVPFISIFLIWYNRAKLAKQPIQPSKLGWLLFIPGLLIHLASAALRVYFSSGFSLLFILSGLVLIFLGKEYYKRLLFPIGFLVFMIPLPLVAIASISFNLKIFAAHVSTIIVNKIGIPAVRDGSIIKTMHSYLMVEDPCSGIRSLIALIALGALMAYFSNTNRIKKLVIFACSMPIAVCSNIIRIVALTVVSEIYGSKYASGVFHDTMGLLVFVFAFVGLSMIAKLLE